MLTTKAYLCLSTFLLQLGLAAAQPLESRQSGHGCPEVGAVLLEIPSGNVRVTFIDPNGNYDEGSANAACGSAIQQIGTDPYAVQITTNGVVCLETGASTGATPKPSEEELQEIATSITQALITCEGKMIEVEVVNSGGVATSGETVTINTE